MDFIVKNNRKLRTGITTGTCAAAAAKASVTLLLSGERLSDTTIATEHGKCLHVAIFNFCIENEIASCSVKKDAGDDPDVTDGIEIVATVTKTNSGINIEGGVGVGRVTKPGLSVKPGCAAINPVPMRTIRHEVENVCKEFAYTGGLNIVISAMDGVKIAEKTMNHRLGIVGGISILGTTGIVEPMSEKAIIDTIKANIDMRLADGDRNLLITPGNYGREFAKCELGFDFDKAVMCSNFIGETLDYVHFLGVKKIVMVGHAGKMIKLAGGIMNTHSSIADCRLEILAAHAAMHGAGAGLVRKVMGSVTVDAAVAIVDDPELLGQIWSSIGKKIAFHLHHRTGGKPVVEFYVFMLENGLVVHGSSDDNHIGE